MENNQERFIRIYRNPNGLYPVNPFPEDYPKRISAEKQDSTVLKLDWSKCRMEKQRDWHGYTGAIGYLPEPPLPSYSRYVAHSTCPPLAAGIKYHEFRRGRPVRESGPDIPYDYCQMGALSGPEIMTRVIPRMVHSIRDDIPDSRQWRFDGRDHQLN